MNRTAMIAASAVASVVASAADRCSTCPRPNDVPVRKVLRRQRAAEERLRRSGRTFLRWRVAHGE